MTKSCDIKISFMKTILCNTYLVGHVGKKAKHIGREHITLSVSYMTIVVGKNLPVTKMTHTIKQL